MFYNKNTQYYIIIGTAILSVFIISCISKWNKDKKHNIWRIEQKTEVIKNGCTKFLENTIYIPLVSQFTDKTARFIINTFKNATCPGRLFIGVLIIQGTYDQFEKDLNKYYKTLVNDDFPDNLLKLNIRIYSGNANDYFSMTISTFRKEKFVYFLQDDLNLKNGWDEIIIKEWNKLNNINGILIGTIPLTECEHPVFFVLRKYSKINRYYIQNIPLIQNINKELNSLFAIRIGTFGPSDLLWHLPRRGNPSMKWFTNGFKFYLPNILPIEYNRNGNPYKDPISIPLQDVELRIEDYLYDHLLFEKYCGSILRPNKVQLSKRTFMGTSEIPSEDEILAKYGSNRKFMDEINKF